MEIIERVVPQEGQGKFVINLNKHNSAFIFFINSSFVLKYSQRFPAKQVNNTIIYNLFLFNAKKIKLVEVSTYFFLW